MGGICELGFGVRFLRRFAQETEVETDYTSSKQIQRTKSKDNSQTGRKYVRSICLIKVKFVESIENSYNLEINQ